MASVGPNSAGAGASVDSGGGSWLNPGRVVASDNSKATLTIANGDPPTDYIAATTFGFSIPVGATITGVVVEVEAMRQAIAGAGSAYDAMFLTLNGTAITGAGAGSGGGSLGTSDAYETFGSSTDLWGVALTRAQVEASTFGCMFTFRETGTATHVISVDHVRMTVYYTPASILRQMMNYHGGDR